MNAPTTRRALLAGAAIALPVWLVIGSSPAAAAPAADHDVNPSPTPANRTVWRRRLRLYDRRAARLEEYQAGPFRTANLRFTEQRDRFPDAISMLHPPGAWDQRKAIMAELEPFEEHLEALADQRHRAMELVVATPAPTLRDLQTKLELWIAEEPAGWVDARIRDHLLADLRRLT